MRILLVAATEFELKPLLSHFNSSAKNQYEYKGIRIKVLITGVGMMATAYNLSKELFTNECDLILNLGICGAFDRSLELGQVVSIASDKIIEEGAENGHSWISLEEMGLRSLNEMPFQNGVLLPNVPKFLSDQLEFTSVKAITVNRVLGEEGSIQKMLAFYNPQVESMEGAAVYYCCRMEQKNCLQLRGVSNYVENRNREGWEIDKALANLAMATLKLLAYVKA